ncbi:MAG: heme-binding protein [Bryobacteraceae bacterium]|nr:heme-binding protein [Bryobacteraceae bacterium]
MTKLKTLASLLLAAASINAATVADRQSITLEGARKALARTIAEARRLNTTGAFAVVDEGGNLLLLERLDGTFAASSNVALGKARTAALFQKPTRSFEEVVNKGRASMIALSGGALDQFTPLQGGVPLLSAGQVVGAIGVSGAASAAQDEELATLGAKTFEAPPAPVTFFAHEKVEQAFAQGAVLFDQSEKYMVHASRRTQPGMAEIHTEDADIVYVLDGTATFVTGGKALDAKATGAGEMRGRAIEGGEVHQLKKGDVVIVPAGVPHWFKEVSDPFLYYVVKAR